MKVRLRRLPPLNALKAFEAAARHESFTRAAEELFVTQGAVSHQVKALEEELGVKLFNRERQRLIITEAGRQYLTILRDAFDRIALGTERLLQRQSSGALRSARRRTLPRNGWSIAWAGSPRNIRASICACRRRCITSTSRARMSTLPCAMATATGRALMWRASARSSSSRYAAPSCSRVAIGSPSRPMCSSFP